MIMTIVYVMEWNGTDMPGDVELDRTCWHQRGWPSCPLASSDSGRINICA